MTQQTATRPIIGSKSKPILVAIGCTAVAGIGLFAAGLAATQVTTSAVSPDQQFRAEIVDRSIVLLDRNFRLCVVDGNGNSRTVFRSPDEPLSGIAQERLLWSKDSKQLLVVGKFWVREASQLPSGECLYLLYDLPSGQIWCNSDQQRYLPFDQEKLEGFDLKAASP